MHNVMANEMSKEGLAIINLDEGIPKAKQFATIYSKAGSMNRKRQVKY